LRKKTPKAARSINAVSKPMSEFDIKPEIDSSFRVKLRLKMNDLGVIALEVLTS
jgi:hypothetical protein